MQIQVQYSRSPSDPPADLNAALWIQYLVLAGGYVPEQSVQTKRL